MMAKPSPSQVHALQDTIKALEQAQSRYLDYSRRCCELGGEQDEQVRMDIHTAMYGVRDLLKRQT